MAPTLIKNKDGTTLLQHDLWAQLSWLGTFSQFSQEERRDASAILVSEILGNNAVAAKVLAVAEEVCGRDSTQEQVSNSENVYWDESLKLVMEVSKNPTLVDACNKNVPKEVLRVTLVSCLLCFAISEACTERRTYIGRIMELDPKVQQRLQVMIQSQGRIEYQQETETKSGSASPRASRNYEEAFGSDVDESSGLTPPKKKRDSTELSSDSEYTTSPETVNRDVSGTLDRTKKENDELKEKLQTCEQRESDIVQQLQNMEAKHRQAMMKVESAAMRNEEDLRESHSREISSLKATVEVLSSFQRKEKKAQEELETLRDEIDVLRHNKAKMEEMEDKVRNYQERLEEAADVKEALKREEAAHGASVEECLRLTNELQILQPLKRQLEVYKARTIDAEVKLADCQDDLKKMEDMSQMMNNAQKGLLDGARFHQEEVEELRSRLEKEGGGDSVVGVGEGISELNPAVKEELLRLRNENAQLKEFASKREEDSVQKLEEELDDKERLSVRFKQRFLDTKAELEQKQQALTESREREETLSGQVAEWTRKTETTEQLAESYKSHLETTTTELDVSQRTLKESQSRVDDLECDVKVWIGNTQKAEKNVEELSESLETTKNQLEKVEQSLLESQKWEAQLRKDVAEWTDKARKAEERVCNYSEKLGITQITLKETKQILDEITEERGVLQVRVRELTFMTENLEKNLAEVCRSGEEAMKAADTQLIETVKSLKENATKELESLKEDASLVIASERKTFEIQLSQKTDEYRVLKEKYEKELFELQQESAVTLASQTEDLNGRIAELIEKHNIEVEALEKTASDQEDAIIRKGRTMLKEVKLKAREKQRELEEELEEQDNEVEKLKAEHTGLVHKYNEKVSSYKKKLEYATNRINDISRDNDELQDDIQTKERELFVLREENDRFQRQLGCCYGSDGKLEKQIEILKKEFSDVVEENSQLKERAKGEAKAFNPFETDNSSTDNPTGASYSRGSGSIAIIGQIRKEYEEAIQVLKDEKRELVMRSSAAITDVQKAEQRAWEADQEVEKLKDELTSVQLALERSELSMSQEEALYTEKKQHAAEASPRVANRGQTSDSAPSSVLTVLSPNRPRSTMKSKDLGLKEKATQPLLPIDEYYNDSDQVAVSNPSNKKERKLPTLTEFPTVGDASLVQDGPPDCQQS